MSSCIPRDAPLSFSSRVTVRTESDWRVATGMTSVRGAGDRTYSAATYHDLVDMPFFVGNFDVDSAQVSGKWMRFATYPVGSVTSTARQQAWDQLKRSVPPQVAVFGDVPWDNYTVLQIVDSTFQGASGLEHANSHVDIFSPVFIGSEFQPSLYAHEIFHAWNVKRLRPAELWPYQYDTPQPTPWLWVSEGITDYYADLALVRGGITSDSAFYAQTTDKINQVDAAGAIALEDASLNTWIASGGRHAVHLLSQRFTCRPGAGHRDPGRERQSPLARPRDARCVRKHLQARAGLHAR